MNRKERQEARADRYRELAIKSSVESDVACRQSSEMASIIPMGQPIHGLADRKYREKIGAKMDKSIELSRKAEYFKQKAAAAESNDAVYLGDDDAVERLESKLADLEKKQETMKETNKIIRSKKLSDIEKHDRLIELGYSENGVREAFTPNFMGEIGFPSCSITNNGANIRRVKCQLEKAMQMKVTEDKEYKIGNVRVVENYQENRLQLFFPGKPDENVRTQLKHNGFRWSRFNGCWQSYLKRWQIERAKEIIGG